MRHLPRSTRIEPPGGESFEVAAPDGVWLVPAGYLSRIHALLGRDEPVPGR